MKINFKIKNKIKVMTALAVLFVFIAFSESRQGTVIVHDIAIKIENLQENHFIDDQDIIRLMQLDQENIKGAPINRLNLKEIEKRIKADRYIKDAELYSDIKGNLVVKATLRRPIARIVRSDYGSNQPDYGYRAEYRISLRQQKTRALVPRGNGHEEK